MLRHQLSKAVLGGTPMALAATGAVGGGCAAFALAPGCFWASAIGWLMLPIAFVVGARIWKTLLLARALWSVGRGVVQRSTDDHWRSSAQDALRIGLGATNWKWLVVGVKFWRSRSNATPGAPEPIWSDVVLRSPSSAGSAPLSGGFIFAFVGLGVGLVAGVATSFAPSAASAPTILVSYVGLGVAFGAIAGRMAQAGRVPIPE